MLSDKNINIEMTSPAPPHIKSGLSLSKIMFLTLVSLLPASAFSVFLYGINTLFLICISVASAVIAELVFQLFTKRRITISDGSAAVTGLLIAMNVPPAAPLWITPVASIFSIVLIKQSFGGLGFNIFNPALAGLALLAVLWPSYMNSGYHGISTADILSKDITGTIFESLFMKSSSGCIGEASAILLILGAAFLLFNRVISWHIPLSCIATVGIFMFLYFKLSGFGFPAEIMIFHVLSGSLLLYTFFMATDPVTTPVTRSGMIIFGAGCGIITCCIKLWSVYPQGACYSILLMNAAVPLIDLLTGTRVFKIKNKS